MAKPASTPQLWLYKSEPETYSFETLLKEKRTNWDQVRNFQARNFLKQAQVGDLALIYHSGKEKAVVGLARVTRTAYPDIDPEGGDWVQIDLEVVKKLPLSVSLAQIKATPALKDLKMLRQSQLSCMPVTQSEFDTICRLGGAEG